MSAARRWTYLRYLLFNLCCLEAEVFGQDEARRRYVERLWAIIEARS